MTSKTPEGAVMQSKTISDDAYSAALRDIVSGCIEIERRIENSSAEDWPARREELRVLGHLIRKISDAHSQAEAIVKAEAPPECELRIRQHSSRPGTITDMREDGTCWLVIAARDGHVLEILQHDNEWSHEVVARFDRACATSADQHLAGALASGKAVQS